LAARAAVLRLANSANATASSAGGAVAAGEAGIDQCPPGGAEGVARLARLTGRPVIPLNPAFGTEGPRHVAVIDEDWCIGCTLCIAACPTDAILGFRDAMVETKAMGFEAAKAAQWALGGAVRGMLAAKGVASVAAEGFQAPGVVVSYTSDPEVQTGAKFRAEGLQIAAGVPLQVGEGPEFRTFRLGLFGLDKLKDVEGTVARLRKAVEAVL
jgi:NAD-dependent dihydropyrimidine dehydrogenase PreA subunit